MPDTTRESGTPPMRLIGLVIARAGRVALLLGGPARWHTAGGRCFVPLELPGGEAAAGATLSAVVAALGQRWLGVPALLAPNARTYGPSATHRVDRLAVADTGNEPPPLASLERMRPRERAAGPPALQPVAVRAYRARVVGEPAPGGESGDESATLLWLPLGALRQVVRGMPLADLLALPDVAHVPVPGIAQPPADAVVYLPAEYGERYLLRVAAKYGRHALFEGENDDGIGV